VELNTLGYAWYAWHLQYFVKPGFCYSFDIRRSPHRHMHALGCGYRTAMAVATFRKRQV